MFNDLFGKYFKFSFVIFIIFDGLSFLAYQNNFTHIVLFLLLALIVLIAAWYKLEYGLYIMLGELFIGSQGHLLSLDTPILNFSLRMVIFLMVILIWLGKILSGRELDFFSRKNKFLIIYCLLFIAILAGALNGLLNNSWNNAFFDLNGWIFFLAAPIFFSIINSEKIVKNILAILFSAVCFISVKTLIVLVVFAHPGLVNISIFYNWLRDSRMGEITYVIGSFYRIFFQAQIYALIGFFISFVLLLQKDKLLLLKPTVYFLRLTVLLSSTALIACLSRSFWVGWLGGFFILLGALAYKYQYGIAKIFKIVVAVIIVAVLEIGFLYVITNNLSNNLIKNRLENVTEEAAGMSRLSQFKPLWSSVSRHWLLGAGFGKTVTYYSRDPRILAKSPTGYYETYAFEWGYLDIWLKIGFFGLMIYLFLYYAVVKEGLKILAKQSQVVILAFLISLISLLITSIFSPYLNHPLGIGFLLLLSAYINYYSKQNEITAG